MYKRFWLNKGRGRAFMEVDVADETKEKKHVSGSISITDCGRMVTLDLDCSKETRNERVRKVRSMIVALQAVEKALVGYTFGKSRRSDLYD